jgi:asparagine synthase (glutamine-hydrolysing)
VSLPAHAAHHHWRRLFATAALGDLLQPEALDWALASDGLDEFERAWHVSPDPDPLCRAMYTDMKTWLPCDILVKVDRATMAHGLESRAPFLHPAVAATAWGLSRAERVDGRRTKVLLRALARERGAREAAARPKRGFNAPVSRWFAASGSAFARERLMSLSMRRLFREPSLERMLREHAARESDHGFRLLALCVLSEWIERRRSRVVA